MPYIDQNKCHRLRGICYHLENNHAAANFIDGYGLGINRILLSESFLSTIKKYPSITLIENAEITSLESSYINFIKDNSLHRCSTNFIVGADGLRSSVREMLDIKLHQSFFRRWAMTTHFAMKPWSSLVEIYLCHSAEAYVVPTGPEEINIVLMWSPKKLSLKGSPPLSKLFSLFPDLSKRLNGAEIKHKPFAIGPFHHRARRRFSSLSAALIGDAAGYVDPLTGEGINYGLHDGIVLGERLAGRIKKGERMRLSDLLAFQLEADIHKLPHTALSYVLLLLQDRPEIFGHVLGQFKRHPQILSALTAISTGTSLRKLYETFSMSSSLLK